MFKYHQWYSLSSKRLRTTTLPACFMSSEPFTSLVTQWAVSCSLLMSLNFSYMLNRAINLSER